MKRWKRVAVATAVVVAALLALIVLVGPGVVRDRAVQWVAARTGRTLTIERIRVNPLTLSIEIHGLALTDSDTLPFVAFERLRLNLSARSLLERALIVKELRLERPSVRLVRTAANAYNFSDLLALGSEEPSQPTSKKREPLRFSLNNITVTDGSIEFIDQAVMPTAQHRVHDLQLAVPFVGNVAYLADEYVSPHLSASVNDAPFTFEGKLKPFADTVEATVGINIVNLDLPEYAAYLPAELPVRTETGHLSTALEVSYRVTRDAGPQVALTGDVTLTGLKLSERSGAPLCFLPLGMVNLAGSEPFSDRIDLKEIIIYGLEVTLSRNRQGGWNYQRLASDTGASSAAAAETGETSAGSAPLVTIGSIRLRAGQLHFRDELPDGGFATELKEISFDLQDFATNAGKNSPFNLALESERGETIAITGNFALQPLVAAIKVEAAGIPLAPYFPYISTVLNRTPAGTLNAGAEVELGTDGAVQLKNGTVTLRDFTLPFGGGDGMRLARLAIGGIAVDSSERKAEVGTVEVENGELRFSRDAEGTLSPLSLPRPAPTADKPPEAAEERPFSWRIGRVTAAGFNVAFTDGMLSEQPSFTLRNIALDLAELHSPGPAFDSLTASAAYGRRGVFDLSAAGRAVPLDITGRLRLRRIPLIGINPYLPENFHVGLVSADLDAGLNFVLQQATSGLSGKVDGSLGVRDFYATETLSGDDLLLWESLQLDKVQVTLSPFALHIGEVALNDFQARVIINPDGSINLQRAFGGGGRDGKETPPLPASTAETKPESDQQPDIAIDAFTLQKGTIDFTDRHMRPTYQVQMLNLGGRIGNMSTAGGKPAEVDLRGNLRNESPLSITGSVDPLHESLYLDLKVRFSDIELSPASPYTGRYLGYLVEKGKLFLDLDYHIESHRLESRNRIFLDQFTFGERVESEDATSLPVRLAIALLKDRKGEIHLDLPVTGRTDDPQFSIWGLVWQVLKNLLVKAATSPIALLTSMFGGGEEFSFISFPYGSARLSGPEQENLAKLASALKDRPALKLEVMGYADRERDPEGYREELLAQRMRREKYLDLVKSSELAPGATAEAIQIAPAEEPKYLEAVYKKSDFPKPRNFVGLVKNLPAAEMRKLILANTEVGETELKALAWGRGAAVRSFLVETEGVPSERIFQKQVDVFQPAEGAGIGGNRVEFGVAAP
jgi:uncharacterized protein involved in outer membrane biogenesis